MNIQNDCVTCIVGQIDKAIALLKCDEKIATKIKKEVEEKAKSFSFSNTPPFVARDVYEYLAKALNMDDPLEVIKQESIKTALTFVPFLKEKIATSNDKLFTAIKTSVAGNVIDFGAKEQFCLTDEINSIFDRDFAINDYEILKSKINEESKILILADNSGENVFDKILIETIKEIYPTKEIFYATRGKAIINDITTKEAYQIGIDKFATILDSGVDTPGLELSRASDGFKNLFKEFNIIIAKGMGNFECLEASNDDRIFFLFKVKCNVVANTIDQNIGEIILKRG